MTNILKPTHLKRVIFFIIFDIIISVISLFWAYNLRFNFHIPFAYLKHFWDILALIIVLKISILWIFKIYRTSWRFFSLHDARKLFLALIITYVIASFIIFIEIDMFEPIARSILILDFLISFIFMGFLRFSKRLVLEQGSSKEYPTLIIGANSKANEVIRSFLNGEIRDYPVAILDNGVPNTFLNNVKVYSFENLEEIVKNFNIKSVIFTRQLSNKRTEKLIDDLNNLGVFDIKKVQLFKNETKLKKVTVEDFLARQPKDLDSEAIEKFVKNKRVLVTGGGGSIGSEIVRQCNKFGASKIAIVDHSEYNLYQIGEEVKDAKLSLISVVNRDKLKELFVEFKPDIVIHAAAYKHVPICEENIESAIINNIIGTKNVVDISIETNVNKLVIISTDKAVRPTNVMGATKRVTELYEGNVDHKNTEIVAVRFGNVLGSSGSVIPKFTKQIEQGGPVTVTHPEMTRYFMLIPEACQLVLQAAAIAKGGELFILDMGEPVKISDLAKSMIRLYGKEGEVEIVYTGLRPGEKLYEELLIDESEQKTKYASIFVAKRTVYPIEKLEKDIENLLKSKNKIEALQKIVPEFTHEV